jgi:hypothetical protein
MILAVLAGATAGFAAPIPKANPGTWIPPYSASGVAKADIRNATWIDVMIDNSGRPFHCRVSQTSGVKKLDDLACSSMLARAKFTPAQDASGAKLFGSYSGKVTWDKDVKTLPLPAWPDTVVDVNKLPADAQPYVLVRQIENPNGEVESCELVMTSRAEALDKLACKLAAPLAKADPLADEQKNPVRAVRVREVVFMPKDQPAAAAQ